MTKRTRSKAAQAASRVMDDDVPYKVWNLLNVIHMLTDSKHVEELNAEFIKYIENSKTSAASALAQKEGK